MNQDLPECNCEECINKRDEAEANIDWSAMSDAEVMDIPPSQYEDGM